jgi:hypothetical protein
VVRKLIPEIENWMEGEQMHLTEAQVLPFLCNFMVAQFLTENYSAANRTALRILQMPDRNVRKDIRAFALVLQAVLHVELNNTELHESLTRAGKRHFKDDAREINFESVVFRYLERRIRLDDVQEIKRTTDSLMTELEKLAEATKGQIPVLGLNEIRLWVRSKQTGEPLTAVFLDFLKQTQDGTA